MGPLDAAAHSYKNIKTGRTQVQYGEGGYAYIYLIYGMHHCMNIVTNKINIPEAVLIRALEPVEGMDLMELRRGIKKKQQLCNGPGKLCAAMGIDKRNYGMDLCGEQLYLEKPLTYEPVNVVASKRINIDYSGEAKDYLWRFAIENNSYVSK
ncbi:MAG: 3-methyladenine glycosylase [Lachnospiraceae bacterium]|nr:3-methyladenine glycosylase [Lachnospiraceae bacterium]